MKKQSLLIYNFEPLFQILNEIKINLNFEIINLTKEKFKNINSQNFGDFIILTKSNLNIKNQILLENFPYKLNQLIQVININFLKNKYNAQSEIYIGNYVLDINSRKISKDNNYLELTEKECSILMFVKESEKSVKIDQLQEKVWGYKSELETHTVETHIYRLRKKIFDKFSDDEFIISDKKGYLLNEEKK